MQRTRKMYVLVSNEIVMFHLKMSHLKVFRNLIQILSTIIVKI